MNSKELRDKFDKDLKELQNNCKHEDISNWMDYELAPGHFGGMVKICNFCEKIVQNDAVNNKCWGNQEKE